jgi:Uma2 family endonuclease
MSIELARRRFTVAEYHRMGEAGIFTEDDRVELLDGEIVTMTPIGSAHSGCVNRLNRLMVLAARDRAVVTVQNLIALGPTSEPQPDMVLARPWADLHVRGHPTAADIWLVVEVSDTTVTFERDVKVPLYAAAGIPEAWVVDLPGAAVEVFRGPAGGRYAEVIRRRRGERMACAAFPDLELPVGAILG